ncbi:MAG TPA: response regulator transcription factor [Candidatus Competibacteraceae bacterium]|nr:response regulator transcription factor [Candidatus Competibacteraceae bacterium]
MRVLLVEDDSDLADGLVRALRQCGYAVDHMSDGRRADSVLRTEECYDLVILDLTLPGLDGLEVLRRLRGRGRGVPVLVLTARGELQDRVTGLDLGADDYLTKPFALSELQARVRALVRRSQGRSSAVIEYADLRFDTVARRVTVRGAVVELPRRELCLLEILLARCGQVVSKEQIAERLFGFDDEAGPNAIELYVHRLRKRLGAVGLHIRTVRGLGYLLEEP